MGKLAELNESLAAIRGDKLPPLPNEVATAIEGLCERMEAAIAGMDSPDLKPLQDAVQALAERLSITVEPRITVKAPSVTVEPPAVSVEAPTVNVSAPEIEVEIDRCPVRFDITRDSQGRMLSVMAIPVEVSEEEESTEKAEYE